jgi:hypothetical protein
MTQWVWSPWTFVPYMYVVYMPSYFTLFPHAFEEVSLFLLLRWMQALVSERLVDISAFGDRMIFSDLVEY